MNSSSTVYPSSARDTEGDAQGERHRHKIKRTTQIASGSKQSGMATPIEFNPLIASAWADAIVALWRTAFAKGCLDPSQPLDVLDLMPGSGESVLQMIIALQSRIAVLPEFSGFIRYLPVAPRRDLLSVFRTHPEFRVYLENETIVPVLWDPERGDPCLIYSGRRATWSPSNPAAILSHHAWALEEQRLCAVHYGKLLEADIELLSNCSSPDREALHWRPLETSGLDKVLGLLLQACISKFNSVPLALPTGAVNQLQRISKLARNGFLLLCVAPGLTSEKQTRLSHFSDVIKHYRLHNTIPLNFWLISEYCSRMSALTCQTDLKPGVGSQAVVGNLKDLSNYLLPVSKPLGALTASTALYFVNAARAIASGRTDSQLDILLALIKRSEYDPEVLNVAAETIVDEMRNKPDFQRQPWIDALERIWSNHLPSKRTLALHRTIAPIAMRINAWAFARKVLERGIAIHGDHVLDLAHLAWCEMRTGNALRALSFIRRAELLNSQDRTVSEVLDTIVKKVHDWTGGWAVSVPSLTLPIVLEPLDVGHADALWYQYRDPQISVMTGLPPLPTLHATRCWITEHIADSSRRSYAIMHKNQGFIGYVGLSVADREAYFCFWIGADFQGGGISVEGGKLLMELGRKQGMAYAFTSAYQDNIRSLAALKKIGFAVLPVRALPPEHDRIFLFMNLSNNVVSDPVDKLKLYYENEKLPLYFPGQEKRRDAESGKAGFKNSCEESS